MEDDTKLARWLSGEMDEQELELLRNSPEYPTLARIKENFDRLKSPEFNQQQILRNVLDQQKKPVKIVPLYKKAWLRIAAMVVILLGVSIVFFSPEHKVAQNKETLAFRLPDDSEVLLNSGSKVSYRSWNWNRNREIELDGEAYFKVAKGKKFEVKTALGTVAVLGTKFNVRAREKSFDVMCFEGKVRVGYGSQQTVLQPGESVSVRNGTAEMAAVARTAPAWANGELLFSKETLESVLFEIERRYGVEITSNVASTQEFSGSLPGDDLDAALKIVSLTFHLKAIKKQDQIILSAADAPR